MAKLRTGSLRVGGLQKPARGGLVFGFTGQRIDKFLGTRKMDKQVKADLKAGRTKLSPQGKIQVTAKGARFFKMKAGSKLKRRS